VNKFEIEGKWRSVAQNDWIHGTLSFDPETRSSISLFGSFTEHTIPFLNHKINLVVGRTPIGDFTLVDLDYRSFSSNRNFGTITTYNITLIFKGIQVENKDELIFSDVSFSSLNLESWFNPPNLTIQHNVDDWSFKLEGKSTAIENFKLKEGILLNIDHDVSIKPQNYSNTHIIEKSTDLNISYNSRQNWLVIWKDVQCFVSFISFCTNEQSYPTKLILKDNVFTEKIGDSTKIIPVELFFQTTMFHSGSSQNEPRDHLLPYSILRDNFQFILKTWFELYETFQIPINLINSRLKSKRFFNENRFLDAAHALEVFHRLDSNINKFPADYFYKLKITAMSAFADSKKDREWMEQLLRYANEPSLRQRMKDLIDKYDLDFLFEDNKEKKDFINMAINTRNYFTHYDSSIKSHKASGAKLIYITRTLTAILYLCITAKLAIDESKSKRAVKDMLERL
tara:strand:- start:2016 stop:3377 length:1362 start_codon:yes stop_codon:yes gene_type:complete